MLPSIESMASKNEPHLSSSTDQKLCVDFAIYFASFEFFFSKASFSIIYYTNFLESSLTAHKRVPAMLLRTSVANGPFAMRLLFLWLKFGDKKQVNQYFWNISKWQKGPASSPASLFHSEKKLFKKWNDIILENWKTSTSFKRSWNSPDTRAYW